VANLQASIHNLLYKSEVKIHDYNLCCTYQFPCLNAAAAAAAAAADMSGTDSVAEVQQFVLRSPVDG
jgi:hypothetical protein